MISNRRSSEASQRAVRGNQGQSVVIMSNRRAISSTQSHAEATQRSSVVIRGTQRHSEALKGTQRHSDAIRRNQTQSDAISGTQQHSEGTQRPLRGHRDPRRPRGPRLPAPSLVARRRRARARLLRHRRAHLPVPFAADDPRSAALVLRVPAPQDGETPADLAKSNGNAEVMAFFASGQVRPIRVQSEGTQRALRGHQRHSVAIRGLSEASQRHAERPSEAIRGHSEALTGHQRALRGYPWQSFAISSTKSHSVAIKRAPGPKTATMATSRAERAPCACACARVRSTCRRRLGSQRRRRPRRSKRQTTLSLLQLSLRTSPSPALPHR